LLTPAPPPAPAAGWRLGFSLLAGCHSPPPPARRRQRQGDVCECTSFSYVLLETLILSEGMVNWLPINQVPELYEFLFLKNLLMKLITQMIQTEIISKVK
jgi:hypothetical protein